MIVALPEHTPPLAGLGKVHFVGIGGVGMSGIASIMLARGVEVSGSDAAETEVTRRLRECGATVAIGHDEANISGVDTVVVSTAIRENNPEIVAATRAGLRIIPRAAALASLMGDRQAVIVTGTHGKTTTTSMVTVALAECGVDASFAIGGALMSSGAGAYDGSSEIFVAEGDESDGSFLAYSPHIAVVTNVEADHLDNYGDESSYVAAFDALAEKVTGVLIVCADDPGAHALGQRAAARGTDVRTYGESPDADVRVTDITTTAQGATTFALVTSEGKLPEVSLRVPGKHNVLNAAAAVAVGLELGNSLKDLTKGVAGFTGTQRRFEFKGQESGVRVFDDYAHHPTEVAAVVSAARAVAGEGRVVGIFQPHLYSRTRLFSEEFGQALSAADEVIVMDVYAAREDPEPGVTGALVADAVDLPDTQVTYVPGWSQVSAVAAARLRSGDLLLTMGAGDVTKIGPEVLKALKDRELEQVR